MSRRAVLLTVAVLLCSLPAAPRAAEPADLPKLRKEQLTTAQQGLALIDRRFQQGNASSEAVLGWARRVLNAELALSDTKADRVAAYEKYLQRLQQHEERCKAHLTAGVITNLDYLAARYDRQGAEAWLAEAKQK
jgi:hypothetical protein